MIAPEVLEPASAPGAEAQRPAPLVLRCTFSFPVTLSALLVVLVVLTVRNRFNDPDMWWHLKTGEIIWNTHHIPTVDTFSYTVAGHAWILQEWLSQLTIYATYHLGGYCGMMLWLCCFASLLLIGGFALCWRYSGNGKVAFLGALTIWLFSTVGLSIRPHLLGYLCLIAELLILQLGQTRDRRWFYLLPPLFCLWINLHSSFMLGLVVLGIVVFCSFWDFRVGLLISNRWDSERRKALIMAAVLAVAALFVNPVGPKLITYPLVVMLRQHVNLGAVSEWQTPDLSGGRGFGLLAITGAILFLPIVRETGIFLQEVVLLATAFLLGVQHDRMLFPFGILAAPVLCRLLANTWERYEFDKDLVLPNAVLLALAAAGVWMAFPSATNLNAQVQRKNPVGALAFLRRARISGPMLNDYISGGYLIWAAPERKVFIDGRADLYDPAGVMAEYGRWAMLEAETATLLDRRQIAYCVLSRDASVTRSLRLLPDWKTAYSDDISIVFVRTAAPA